MRTRRSEAETQQPVMAAASVKCAIYTRKSTDEGLAQEFNSLDAQRESCENYIASQRHEGWTALARTATMTEASVAGQWSGLPCDNCFPT